MPSADRRARAVVSGAHHHAGSHHSTDVSVRPATGDRQARQAAIEHSFQHKKPVPCLLPTNPFIARSHKRDDDHLRRSQLGFAHAVARCTEEGRHELRMLMQPHVTLHYEEDAAQSKSESEVHIYVRLFPRVDFGVCIFVCRVILCGLTRPYL